jgi:hypothetical protein
MSNNAGEVPLNNDADREAAREAVVVTGESRTLYISGMDVIETASISASFGGMPALNAFSRTLTKEQRDRLARGDPS